MTRRWVLVSLWIAGCSFRSSEPPLTIDNSCVDAIDCEQGACDGEICIDDTAASVDVAIEVLRSSSDVSGLTPASWIFSPETASGATQLDLDLPATRQARGRVRWNDARVPATLRFLRRMPEPLEAVAIEVATSREGDAVDAPDFDFSVALVTGETYDVVVLPTTDMVMAATAEAAAPALRSLPPLYLEVQVQEGDPAEPFRFDVDFPSDLADPCTTVDDVGCTLETEVISIDGSEPIPEAGLQVRAIDAKDGRVVSSIGETDEYGRVSIRIGETTSGYFIRVTSSLGRAPFPAVSVDPAVAFANDPIEKVIYIPRLSSIQVSGRVQDVQGSPVPGATVRFSSTGIFDTSQLGLQGSFSASATTNEDGTFGAELLSGFYVVNVTPPADADNPWGVLTTEAVVGGELTVTEPFVLPVQIGFRGSVTTFRDEPAPGLTVVARARSASNAVALHRSQEVVSSSNGGFAMTVDEGVYDVHVKVPAETGFAWLVEPDLAVSAASGDLARLYRLAPPIVLRGFVRASDGSSVEAAAIRGYVLSNAEGQSRRIQVAETISGQDGSYQLLIAPGLDGR
jgi:hypothetical protein